MMKIAPKTLLLLLVLTLSGLSLPSCMSLDHLIDPEQRLDMYGGTQESARILSGEGSAFAALISLFDFPFTVVMDTIILPIVAPIVLLR